MKCKLHLVKHVDVTIDVADAEIHVEIANITSVNVVLVDGGQ